MDFKYTDRDLSYLDFNFRVLSQAEAHDTSGIQALRYLSIISSNLEEFFMIRIPAIMKENGPIDAILYKVKELKSEMDRVLDTVKTALVQSDYHLLLDDNTRGTGHLAALANVHRFEWSCLKSLENGQIAIVSALDLSWVPIAVENADILIEGLDESFVHFPDVRTLRNAYGGVRTGIFAIRIFRDADVWMDLEGENPESYVQSRLFRRESGKITYVQVLGDQAYNEIIAKHLDISIAQIFGERHTLCLSVLKKHLPAAYTVPVTRHVSWTLDKVLGGEDILLHYPYDAFNSYLSFLEIMTGSSEVSTIYHTLYRAEPKSKVVEILKKAAINGKEVNVAIELRARFDEMHNLEVAQELKEAGVKVSFGFDDVKLHAKLALFELKDGRAIAYLSTGNFNTQTALCYTDLGLFTANEDICDDVRYFFKSVVNGRVPVHDFYRILVSPMYMHREIFELIHQEMKNVRENGIGYIFIKVNSLVDKAAVNMLYEAAEAGVRIDIIVRGACSLVPIHNMRVLSIVDRLLEHSRIYYFGSQHKAYLSSADWMARNFFGRLEVAFPITGECFDELTQFIIPVYVDNLECWAMSGKGEWVKQSGHYRPQAEFAWKAALLASSRT